MELAQARLRSIHGIMGNPILFLLVTPGYQSKLTGRANTTKLLMQNDAGAPYQAASYCAHLSSNGHNDWYLPAENELDPLWINPIAIGGFNISGARYWTSTAFYWSPPKDVNGVPMEPGYPMSPSKKEHQKQFEGKAELDATPMATQFDSYESGSTLQTDQNYVRCVRK